MPTFFDPAAKDRAQAVEVREKIRLFLRRQGRETRDRKIFRLDYIHNGQREVAEVGQSHSAVGQTVIAIFDGGNIYYVCTADRGVRRDEPILVGTEGTRVTEFDPD